MSFIFSNHDQKLWKTVGDCGQIIDQKELFYSSEGKIFKTTLTLYDGFIKIKENKYIDYNEAIIEFVDEDLLGLSGIRLTKNKEIIEVYGELDEWCQTMKKYVVQVDFSKKYSLIKKLGNGASGTIKSKLTNTHHAAKIINKCMIDRRSKEYKQLLKEIQIIKRIQHPNLVQFQELFESQDHIILVFEYLQGGELSDIVTKNLKEPDVKKIILSIVNGVEYLHQRGIFHRDLKPQNIMLKDSTDLSSCCIVDFGLADYWNPDGIYNYTRCGTPGFVAPELLQDKKYNLLIDVYSIGIIMFLLFTKTSPFENEDQEQLIINNYHGLVDYSQFKQSPQCQEIIQKMLQKDSNERINCKDLLEHPFFQNQKIQNSFRVRLTNMKCTLNNSPQQIRSSFSNYDSSTISNDFSPTTTFTPSPYLLRNKLTPLSSPRKRIQQQGLQKNKNQRLLVQLTDSIVE